MAGSDDGIKRRDFLNGMLLAAGGAAVTTFSPFKAFASLPGAGECDDPTIGTDPRVTRGGNVEAVFNIGHWLRDGRLSFSQNSVKLANGACDSTQGNFPILTDNGNYEVIIVGGGLSGLSAAFYLEHRRPGTKVLILDGQATPGGNANRDDAPPIPNIASTATAYAVQPYAAFLNEIYDTCGINWKNYVIQSPFYCYWFDSNTPYVNPGTNQWNIDTYGAGVKSMPYAPNIVQDLQMAKQDLQNWGTKSGSPTDPADMSDPKYDYLSPMTFDYYLTQVKGFHPAVSDFYTRYAVDALTGTTAQTSAYTSISFLGAEYGPEWAFPGGNSGIARKVLKWLIPNSIAGSSDTEIITHPIDLGACDAQGNTVRLRQGAMVLRGENGSSTASVVYYKDGNFYRATAKAVIFAGQAHTARTACGYLMSQSQLAAYDQVTLCPVVTANVTLRNASALVNLGLGYDNYYWGSKYWADS
jgi:hypothetical protein